MATITITGGTGLIGKALTKALVEKGYKVIILSRSGGKKSDSDRIEFASWDIGKKEIDRQAIERADYIIHLAGAGVADKRWTAKRKKEILDSRVQSSAWLAQAIREYPNNIKAVVSASATGWYGADPVIPNSKPFVETDPAATDFLGQTCYQWEDSIQPVTTLGKRLVYVRTGIVLSREGGALKEFRRPLHFGLATILGNGKQIVSWIHIDDLVQLYITAVENQQLSGVFNAVAPHPVSNKELITQLARREKKFYIPVQVPSFVLKTVLGEMSIEILKSVTVSSRKITDHGFAFTYQSIEQALDDLTKP